MNREKTELAQQGLILAIAAMLHTTAKEVIQDPKLVAWVFKTANEMARLETDI